MSFDKGPINLGPKKQYEKFSRVFLWHELWYQLKDQLGFDLKNQLWKQLGFALNYELTNLLGDQLKDEL